MAALIAIGGSIVSATPGYAKSPKFKGAASGWTSCNLQLTVKFSPPLTTLGGGTHASKVKGTVSSCTSSDPSVQITSAKISGSFSHSPLTCSSTSTGTASASLTFKWKGDFDGTVGGTTYSGAAKFDASTVSFGGEQFDKRVTSTFAAADAIALPGSADAATTSGSFAGSALYIADLTGSLSACSSGGLKSLTLGGTFVGGSMTSTPVSCCLAPPGTPNITAVEPGYNLADPAITELSPTEAEAYATDCSVWVACEVDGQSDNVPSYSVSLSNDAYGSLHDALPTPPSWWGGARFIWAPTVRYIDGQYLMSFSASPSAGGGNCLGMATSSDGLTFAPVNSFELCVSSGGLFDPQFFVNPNDGTVWLYYSDEDGAGSGDIEAQELSADGMSFVGSPTTLLSYSQVSSLNHNEGTNAYLENPAFVADPGNGYGFDLLDSLGTWNGTGTYETIEVPCSSDSGGCQPSQGQVVTGSSYGDDPGSAALLQDSSAAGNLMIWDQWVDGVRTDFIGTTSAAS